MRTWSALYKMCWKVHASNGGFAILKDTKTILWAHWIDGPQWMCRSTNSLKNIGSLGMTTNFTLNQVLHTNHGHFGMISTNLFPLFVKNFWHVHNPDTHQYQMARQQYNSAQQKQLDWEAMGDAMHSLLLTRKHWVTKHVSGWCSVGKMAKRWKLQMTDKCPRCNQTKDARHVWQCCHPTAIIQWDQSIDTLTIQLGRIHTSPEIIRAMCNRLKTWKRHLPLLTTTTYHLHLQEAIAKQDNLGWSSMLEGGILQHWRHAQECFLQTSKSPQTSKWWTSLLIQKLFNVAWDQWEHRNEALHDMENKFDQEAILQPNNSIHQEFVIGTHQLPTADQGLFKAGVQHILKCPIYQKQQWLQHVNLARMNQNLRVHPTTQSTQTTLHSKKNNTHIHIQSNTNYTQNQQKVQICAYNSDSVGSTKARKKRTRAVDT